jgi:hypothetical protein
VRLAEVRVDRYLTEPEAAATSYAHAERVVPGTVVAVYDLGGGTFDACVLRKTDAGFELLGDPEGIERLGGVDFDQAILAHVSGALGGAVEELKPTDPAALAALARLRQECVDAKEALSSDSDASVPVMLPNLQTEVRVTRGELEALIRPPLVDSVAALRRALRSAGVQPEDVGVILLVGGSSRIPLVAQLVGNEFGRPVAVDAHPKHAVALGAALAAVPGVVRATSEPGLTAAASITARPDPSPPRPRPEPRPAPTTDAEPVGAPMAVAVKPRARRRVPVRGLVAAAIFAVVAAGAAGAIAIVGGGDDAGAIAGCPEPGDAAVCITDVWIDNGWVFADFVAQDTELASAAGDGFPAGSVHPLFYFETSGPRGGRVWGPSSPFGGESASGFSGFRVDDAPSASSALCVALQTATGDVLTTSGNCSTLPT